MCVCIYIYNNHHHHHISVMLLDHLLTRSGLTYPEVSSKICHDSFCPLRSSVSLPWVIYFQAFHLHVVSSFPCIPVICPKLLLFLTPLQFVHLFLVCPYIYICISLSRAHERTHTHTRTHTHMMFHCQCREAGKI